MLRPFCICWCWLGLCCSLLPASFTGFRLASYLLAFFVTAWGPLWYGFFGFASGQTEWRWGFLCFRCGWWWRKRQAFTVVPVVARSVGRAPSIPFGRKSHASARKGTQATVRASSVSRGRAGQTESGTRKGTQVVEVCVIRPCQRVSRGSVRPRTRRFFSVKLAARYGVAFSVLQAAKRNGGGVFVAFVVAGGDGKVRLHRRIRCGTQYRKSHNHSVWRQEPRINTPGHAGNGQGTQCLARAGRPNGIWESQGHVCC